MKLIFIIINKILIKLKPIYAKIKFHKLFPNINISTKEYDNYIYGKYREARGINKEKIENTEKFFHLKDDEDKEISQTIDYEIKSSDGEIENLKFVLIVNEEILLNFKNNLIEEYFIDATYSCVPPSIEIISYKWL